MSILLLDEFYGKRAPLLREFESQNDVTAVDDPGFDFRRMRGRKRFEVIGFGNSFLHWTLPNQFLDLFPNAQALCLSGGWYEHVDLPYCFARNIVVSIIPGFSGQAAAEWCLMAALMLARNVPSLCQQRQRVEYDHVCGVELAGKRAGILGLGGIGRILAPMLEGLGLEVCYWSRSTRDARYKYQPVEAVLESVDFLFVTLYDGPAMAGFLNRSRLLILKPTSCVISGLGSQPGVQGDTVDWPCALNMVRDGALGGLAIECGEKEDIPHIQGNIFVARGHSGWLTNESFARQTERWIRSMKGALTGEYPHVLMLGQREADH